MGRLRWTIAGLIIVAALFILLLIPKKRGSLMTDVLEPSPMVQSSPSSSPIRESTKAAMKKTYNQLPKVLAKEQISGKKVRIKTVKGDIVFELFDDTPITSSNFIFLTGEKFYDGLIFHRREEGFVIQGGDPNGNGTGGPGYKFIDEPVIRDYKRGIVAMANAGPNTNGSQFFIMLADVPLPKQYTIFGNVVEGIDVVDKIEISDVMEKVMIE